MPLLLLLFSALFTCLHKLLLLVWLLVEPSLLSSSTVLLYYRSIYVNDNEAELLFAYYYYYYCCFWLDYCYRESEAKDVKDVVVICRNVFVTLWWMLLLLLLLLFLLATQSLFRICWSEKFWLCYSAVIGSSLLVLMLLTLLIFVPLRSLVVFCVCTSFSSAVLCTCLFNFFNNLTAHGVWTISNKLTSLRML